MLNINFPVNEYFKKNAMKVAIVNIQDRKPSAKFDNAEDVKNYPKLVQVGILSTADGTNQGQMLSFKLKQTTGLSLGQQIDFNNPKVSIVNAGGRVWGRYCNQLSVKGDRINVG